ncbi:MAG: DUF362 domain-containing protein [Syntrophorhabdaceae bacterium]|nr:DUF362 domain-containing protein [Syntrophorhabdaceae bacterium]
MAISISLGKTKGKSDKDNQNSVRYVVKDDQRKIGWFLYNKDTSTIEDFFIDETYKDRDKMFEILDGLIAKETLLAIELNADDRHNYDLMLGYGFRPFKTFQKNGKEYIRMELSASVLLEKLKGKKPPVPYKKKEKVVIERVPETLSYGEIKQSVENLIRKLGGLNRFVKKGDMVVIKPNLVSDHGIKDGTYKGGIVTDVRVIKAITETLLPVAGKIIIAEGSSINRSATTKMFELYGYNRLKDIDPAKIDLVDLNSDDLVEKKVPFGKRMTKRSIPVTLDRADAIINVPVMKIHFAAIVSLAVKSLQGAVPPLEKYMTHYFGLWQNLVNIHRIIKPKLTIIDGLIGQEDFGPVSGSPKEMNVLIAGTNPVAIDAVAMRVMGIEPLSSPPVFFAYIQGLGPVEEDMIDIIGPSIDEIKSPFKQPIIDIGGGKDFHVHDGKACSGCKGYLHFVLAKLKRPDPINTNRLLIDRPFDKKVNVFLGPETISSINPQEINIFMGMCQKHNKDMGSYLPGCPPHAEVIVNGIFSLFPDVEKPKYADESEEKKLGEMLKQILEGQGTG